MDKLQSKKKLEFYLLSLKEGDVEDGGVKIHKLEHEHFECQTIFVFCLRSMHFWRGKKVKQINLNTIGMSGHLWPYKWIIIIKNNNYKIE